jgi:hypothetical protein
MANVHLYVGMENLGLNASQKNTFVTAIQGLGQANDSSQPSQRNHWRVRTDTDAVIFEALFDESNLTINAIKQRLADIFGVAVGSISHSTNQNATYGLVVTFTYLAVNRLRMVAFGHSGVAWGTIAQSRAAAHAYLLANAAAWGETV